MSIYAKTVVAAAIILGLVAAPLTLKARDIDPPAPYALTGNETPSDTAEAMRTADLDGVFSTQCEKPLRFGNAAQVYSIAKMTFTGMGGSYYDGQEAFHIIAAKYVSNQSGDDITIRFQNSDDATLMPATEVLQIIRTNSSGFRTVWAATGKITNAPYMKHCSVDMNPLVEPTPQQLQQQLQDQYAACTESVKQGVNQYRIHGFGQDFPPDWDTRTRAIASEAMKEKLDRMLEEGEAMCKKNPYIRAN